MPRPDPTRIHPTAIVSADARLADDVTVGPFAILDGPVTVGPGCRIGPHAHLIGPLALGRGNVVHTGVVLGDAPQHLGYQGEPTRTEIGDFNVFREHVTVHRGMPVETKPGTGVTVIGSHNFFMAGSHVAHDCRVGDHCVFANCAVIGGHAEVHDRAVLSGNTAVHQFCRVGRMAMLGGTTAISQDLPPFWIVQGRINWARGVNIVGMRRAGVPAAEIQAVRHAYRLINKTDLTITAALAQIEAEYGRLPAVRELIDFIRASKRGICTAKGYDGENE
jgi:UDP-N-acetylglucosamine acyltransferase